VGDRFPHHIIPSPSTGNEGLSRLYRCSLFLPLDGGGWVGVKDRSCGFTIPPPPLAPPTPGRGKKKNGRGGEGKRWSHAGEGDKLAGDKGVLKQPGSVNRVRFT